MADHREPLARRARHARCNGPGSSLALAGVALILHDRPITGQAGWGWFASTVSLVSITLGTLYQRRYCGQIDWRSGNLVQYIAVTAFFTVAAFLFEQRGGALDRRIRARHDVALPWCCRSARSASCTG